MMLVIIAQVFVAPIAVVVVVVDSASTRSN